MGHAESTEAYGGVAGILLRQWMRVMLRLEFGAGWSSGTGILARDLAQDARAIINMARLRIVAPVVCLLMLGSASAQPSNLVRNENGNEGLQFWRVFGNASVADCTT